MWLLRFTGWKCVILIKAAEDRAVSHGSQCCWLCCKQANGSWTSSLFSTITTTSCCLELGQTSFLWIFQLFHPEPLFTLRLYYCLLTCCPITVCCLSLPQVGLSVLQLDLDQIPLCAGTVVVCVELLGTLDGLLLEIIGVDFILSWVLTLLY